MTTKRRRAQRREYPLHLLEASLYEIDMPERVVNFLVTINVFTVGDLLQKRPHELLAIRNFGDKSLEIVFDRLAAAGFHREQPKPPRVRRPRVAGPRLAAGTLPAEETTPPGWRLHPQTRRAGVSAG